MHDSIRLLASVTDTLFIILRSLITAAINATLYSLYNISTRAQLRHALYRLDAEAYPSNERLLISRNACCAGEESRAPFAHARAHRARECVCSRKVARPAERIDARMDARYERPIA